MNIELLKPQLHEVNLLKLPLIHPILRLIWVFEVHSSLEYLFTKALDSQIVFKDNFLSHSKF